MQKKLSVLFILVFLITIKAQNGIRKSYYSKKQIESKVSFIKGVLSGTSYWYYENGNLKTEKTYLNGKLNGWVKNFYRNGLIKNEKYVRHGILDGIYNEYYKNGQLKTVSVYNNGIPEKLYRFEYDSNYVPSHGDFVGRSKKNKNTQDDFICNLQICPEPIGGIKAIEKKLYYTPLAKKKKIEGDVLITALINNSGNVESVKVIKKLNYGLDEIAVDAVKNTKFIPGEQNGKNVTTEVTFKLKFKIKNSKLK